MEKGKYYAIIGAYPSYNPLYAVRVAKRVEQYVDSVRIVKDEKLDHVVVGPFEEHEKASAVGAYLESFGIKATITPGKKRKPVNKALRSAQHTPE